MHVETVFEVLFAAGIVVAVASLLAALVERLPRVVGLVAVGALSCGLTAAWVAFALDPSRELALSSSGLTVCAALAAAALALQRGVARGRRIEGQLTEAEQRLKTVVEREAAGRAAELEHTLARARADSLSLLQKEERRIADERRKSFTEYERRASAELSEALTGVEHRVDQRLADWRGDLERVQHSLAKQLEELGKRARQLLVEAEARFRTELERLESDGEDQRAAIARLRAELDRMAREAVEAASSELTTHEAERRRALHEVSERLRQRERELRERIEQEETEAVRRIQASFGDVERRQLDEFRRIVERTANQFSEGAAQQFSETIRGAREDAAKRLSRELDRAVEVFAREAQGVLAERLSRVGDAGTHRLEQRLTQTSARLEREREEFVQRLERSRAEAEGELRTQLQAIAADAEAERAVLEARLHELARRIEGTVASAEMRLADVTRAD